MEYYGLFISSYIKLYFLKRLIDHLIDKTNINNQRQIGFGVRIGNKGK